MNDTKHTSGPWRMTGETWEGDGAAGIGIKSDCGRFVAFVTEWTDRGEPEYVGDEDLANAQLIAAAPALLAACEAGKRYSDALKKYQKSGTRVDVDGLKRLLGDWRDKTHAAIAKATQ